MNARRVKGLGWEGTADGWAWEKDGTSRALPRVAGRRMAPKDAPLLILQIVTMSGHTAKEELRLQVELWLQIS